MNIIYLLLGSNLGNRQQFLNDAISNINSEIGQVTETSSVYETQAWGNTGSPDYLNQVLKVESLYTAAMVLQKVLSIEQQLGRRRQAKWEARVIDIDMLFYNDDIINEPDLIVPHRYLHQRKFTLAPLAEICPDLIHPVLKKNILWLNEHTHDSLVTKKL